MLKTKKHRLYPTVPRKERRLFSSSVLLSSHSATSPGERRLILQPENFSIQKTSSERSSVGRVGRSWWSWDSSTPVPVYTDNMRAWCCPVLSTPHPTASTDMGGSSTWDLHFLSSWVTFRSKQERKGGKKGEQRKPRFSDPKEVAGYAESVQVKIKNRSQCWRSQVSQHNSSSAKCNTPLSVLRVLALFVGSGIMLYAKINPASREAI